MTCDTFDCYKLAEHTITWQYPAENDGDYCPDCARKLARGAYTIYPPLPTTNVIPISSVRILDHDGAKVSTSTMGMGGSLRSGASVEWWTPPHVFEALGLRFDLDPCGPPDGVPWLPATRTLSRADEGLMAPWEGRVWLNPPYGRQTGQWLDRLILHNNGVGLVFARTDTEWCQRALNAAQAVCLIAGRLSFIDGHERQRNGHNAAAPSMLLGFGDICAKAVSECGLGWMNGKCR